ncbi:rhaM [Symbiodinium microadriaticum]|nr:rhaM [Symbiodinium microadriaticum]
MIIAIKPEKIAEYKELHAKAWPEVLAKISDCNIRNYSIYLREPENLLFSYFEYHGDDYEADMAKMGEDPDTQRWWTFTDPCQEPLTTASDGAWWSDLEEVFHHD